MFTGRRSSVFGRNQSCPAFQLMPHSPSHGFKRLKPSPRHPAKNVECYQGSRPLRPVGNVHYAGLVAPYVREQGHLMIWPPGHRYRWAGGGSTGRRDQRLKILSQVQAAMR